jgi:hypothetical protein
VANTGAPPQLAGSPSIGVGPMLFWLEFSIVYVGLAPVSAKQMSDGQGPWPPTYAPLNVV